MKQRVVRWLVGIAVLGIGSWLTPSVIYAGTDLTVTCANQGPCTVNSAAPLFDEANMVPGETRSQTLTIINNDPDDSCNIGLRATGAEPDEEEPDLAAQLFAGIVAGSDTYYGGVAAGQATNAANHRQLFSTLTPTLLGTVNPASSRTYTWYATFNPAADNSYQGLTQTFDFTVQFECVGGVDPSASPSPAPSSSPGSVLGASSTSGGGGTGGSVCTDTAPTEVPVLSISSQSANTVTLTWNNISQTHTHYALFFSRDDGVAYGAGNIGNVTTYTVTNLSGGRTYTFQVLAVNGCAPGPRSNSVSSGAVGGQPTTGEPIGPGGQVLGVEEPSAGQVAAAGTVGEVAGSSTGCAQWLVYLPLILLALQLLLALVSEWFLRSADRRKWLWLLGLPVAMTILFYLFRQCACAGELWWLGWLCQWYWLLAAGLVVVTRLIGFAFIEEVVVKVKKSPSLMTSTDQPPKAE